MVLAFFWAIVRSGTGIYPAMDWYLPIVEQWPVRSTAEFEAYLSDSPLGILLAKVLGATDERRYLWLALIVSLVSLVAAACWVSLHVNAADRWRSARLALLAPFGAVLLTWIGSYDAFTVAVWILVLFAWSQGNTYLLVLSGALLGFQHFEHAVLGTLVLFLIWLAVKEHLPAELVRKNPAWVLAGIFVGRLILEITFRVTGQYGNGRTEWLFTFLVEWNKVTVNIAPQLLWSLFAGFWAVIVLVILTNIRKENLIYFALAFSVGLLALALSGDRPRVFILVFFPATLILIVALLRNSNISLREKRLAETIIWLAPPLIFWGKNVANTNVIDLGTVLIQKL